MKYIYISLLFMLLSIMSIGQSVNLEWAKSVGKYFTKGNSTALDSEGNLYIAGVFDGTVDFDPGEGTFNLTSSTNTDVFILKLDSNGNFVWAKSIGGPSMDKGNSIIIDIHDNVYITGSFGDTVDFDPGDSIFNIATNGWSDIFILKLDNNGDFIWAKSVGGMSHDKGLSIDTDVSGNLYLTGTLANLLEYDSIAGNYTSPSEIIYKCIVQKFDGNGDSIWTKTISGSNYITSTSITIDIFESVYITGYFVDTVDFDPSSATFNLISKGNYDFFVQKLDNNGNFMWAKSTGGVSYDKGYCITTDKEGNVYAAGSYKGVVDFDPNQSVYNLPVTGFTNAFIQKLDGNGNFVWAKSIEGPGFAECFSITTDISGNIYITGDYTGTLDFDPSSANAYLISYSGNSCFVQKLDENGNFIWAKSVGGKIDYSMTTDPSTVIGRSVAADNFGNVYVVGHYDYVADFDPNFGVYNLTTNGGENMFIMKLKPETTGINASVLLNFVSIFPNPTYNNNFNIDLGTLKNVTVRIFDLSGKTIYNKENINTSILPIELNEEAAVYIVEVSCKGEKKYYKLVKI